MIKVKNKYVRASILTTVSSAAMIIFSANAMAQSNEAADETAAAEENVITVTGIRASLETALQEKRQSANIVEVIQAEDIGKLPDQNLAEVLENITGIQITRDAGVGNSVQIRGTDENRIEINGVSTVGSGGGRGGISFEDLPAALISSLEVTKVPDAGTIEGSVGGTINLRTLRPLELRDPLISVRAQGEYSSLSDTFLPRISGTLGNNWDTGIGEIGIVLSGSYARQDVSQFSPRVDRDGVVTPTSGRLSAEDFQFLRIQFFQQDNNNFEFETINFVGSLEWQPTDNLKFYFDGIYNDQNRVQQSARIDISGPAGNPVVDNTTNTSFETVNFGSLDGPNGPIALGSIQAVLTGILEPGLNTTGTLDPNLRTITETGSRVTRSGVYRFGSEWQSGALSISAEGSISDTNSTSPSTTIEIDFINPNHTQPRIGVSIDNGVPIEFDLSNGTLQFGLAQGLSTTPTTAQLLDPANYQISRSEQNVGVNNNREVAGRFDLNYDFEGGAGFISSIDAGYRFNRNSSLSTSTVSTTNFTNNRTAFNRPNGDLFADILSVGPDNFDQADGRRLFIRDFLAVNPEIAFRDPAAITAALNAAITANNLTNTNPAVDGVDLALIGAPQEAAGAFFDITEQTHALYGQVNFDGSDIGLPARGNLGLRWVNTSVSSVGNNVTTVAGVTNVTQVVTEGDYNLFLPRFNLVINAAEDILIRAGVARDLNRPDFDDLSTSITFGTGPSTPVDLGNPDLVPETVWSFDLSAEYYFAPSSFLSVGVFHKSRSGLFSSFQDDPAQTVDINGDLAIDITAPCEAGGIFNPIANRNINNVMNPGVGLCVPLATINNGEGTTTQTGIEVAFQYDLSQFEDTLGFASGFGFIGNYTYQETGGSAQNFPTNFRPFGVTRDIDDALGVTGATARITLTNLSRHSYNTTLYYEKYGFSARARYTWRSSFVSNDALRIGVPVINGSRGQLNGSINYDINENINIGVEGINLTKSDANQFCVNNNALLCFQGLTDRRLVAGVSIKF